MPEGENNLFGEFNVYVIVLLVLVFVPIFLLVVANLLFVKPSKPNVGSGSDVSYPKNADEQKMIECINKYISNYGGSPYNKVSNVGKVFVDAGKQYDIHPGYIVAMSQHESTLCANPKAEGCLCYNGWGRQAASGQPECKGYEWYAYNSWEDGIQGQAKFIKEVYYEQRGLKTVEAITPIYCPATTGCDVEGYKNLMVSESEKAACYPLESVSGIAGETFDRAALEASLKEMLSTGAYGGNGSAVNKYLETVEVPVWTGSTETKRKITAHKLVVGSLKAIFTELAQMKYPIATLGCFREAQGATSGPTSSISAHRFGIACDINENYNYGNCGVGQYKVTEREAKVFEKYGWPIWGLCKQSCGVGDFNTYCDGMHFSTQDPQVKGIMK